MEEKELIARYGLDLESLKKEQIKFSKNLVIKDSLNLSEVTRFGAFQNITVKNKIISVIVVCDKEGNVIEQQYFFDKVNFPYIYGFRAYREMPAMLSAFNKLNEKPEVILVSGHGLDHARLGLASHVSFGLNTPTIGVADSLFEGNEVNEAEEILKLGKKVGKVLHTKENSNPLYVSPGNNISIETSYNVCKELVKSPHKLPEPLHLAYKYAKDVMKELKL